METAVSFRLGPWLAACLLTQLLQIAGDGIASWVWAVSGAVAPGSWPTAAGLLACGRLVSSAAGGWIQGRAIGARRRHLSPWWIATALGSSAGFLLLQALQARTRVPVLAHPLLGALLPARSWLPGWLYVVLAALILAAAQGLLLARQRQPVGEWILLSLAGALGADLWGHQLQRLLGRLGFDAATGASNPLFWLIAGSGALVYGLATGLFWRRRPHPSPVP